MTKHIITALIISFGLSLLFWAAYGVFELAPFLIISTACAGGGALAGRIVRDSLAVTALATELLRAAVFFAVANPFTG